MTAASGSAGAYRAFVAGGWNSLTTSSQHGGQGMSKVMGPAVFEVVCASNMTFGLCPC
ncbi:MAG: hypothetical protein ACRED9_01605 [Caulobacteraceae bacterium]